MNINDVDVLVVHHNNYPNVINTINSIVDAGVPKSRIVVVDNSENAAITDAIRGLQSDGLRVLISPNNGYAAAINFGIKRANFDGTYLLVSTHEALVNATAISRLRRVLSTSHQVGVVGPQLMNGAQEGKIWSKGGVESRWLRLPMHVKSGRQNAGSSRITNKVLWLDGAFCLYRREIFDLYELDERYFLYFEEMAFHYFLRNVGWEVCVVEDAIVSQESGGTPPFYLARNSRIFYREHQPRFFAVVSPIALIIKAFLIGTLRGQGNTILRQLISGYVAGSSKKVGEGSVVDIKAGMDKPK